MTTSNGTKRTPGKELEVYSGPWYVRAWKPRLGHKWDEWTDAMMIEIRAGNTRRILHLLTTLEKDDPEMRATSKRPHAWLRYDVPQDLMAIALGMETDDTVRVAAVPS